MPPRQDNNHSNKTSTKRTTLYERHKRGFELVILGVSLLIGVSMGIGAIFNGDDSTVGLEVLIFTIPPALVFGGLSILALRMLSRASRRLRRK
jgi:hypothetical protein